MLLKTASQSAKGYLSAHKKPFPTEQIVASGYAALSIWEVDNSLIGHNFTLRGRKKVDKSTCRQAKNIIFAPPMSLPASG